ncbi:MAG: PDZ domain-containing protein [Bacteroidia bacterium]
MNSAKFGFLLLLCFSTLSVLGQKRVTVSITQETDRGTITIDTTFEANGEVDLDEVLDRLEMSGDAREERIVVRSNRGPSRTVVVTQDGAARPRTQQGGKVLLGVYLDNGSSCEEGIRISKVTENGAAQRAGMRNGDVLLRLGDFKTNSEKDVVNAKTHLSADEPVAIIYKRGNQIIQAVLNFNPTSGSHSDSYSYNYDYDYNYNNGNHEEEAHTEEHNNNWDWDRDENNSWEADDDAGSKAFLGVYSEDVDEDLAEELGLPDVYGVYIDGVIDNSAAEAAGLQEGDVIVGFDNDDIPTAEALRAYLGSLEPGSRIRVGYYRDGRLQRTTATLGHTQSTDNSWQPEGRKVSESKPYLGVYLEDSRDGVRISNLVDNEAAEDAGLRRGDVIIGMNGEEIDDYDDLKDVMKRLNPGQSIRVSFIRNGERERTRVVLGAKKVERWEKP